VVRHAGPVGLPQIAAVLQPPLNRAGLFSPPQPRWDCTTQGSDVRERPASQKPPTNRAVCQTAPANNRHMGCDLGSY
jgi:hypothetical protein